MSIHIEIGVHPRDVPPPPGNNIPDYVAPEPGWFVNEGDGEMPAVYLHDRTPEDRSGLGETGEWNPVFYVEDGRVRQPKHIINLKGTTWLDWELDILGSRNFAQKAVHGDGTEDTNDDSVPVFLSDGKTINPAKDRKQMCLHTGGAILRIVDTIIQGGATYYVVDSMDFYKQPVKIDGIWYYDNKPMTWESHPYLFASRVNRKIVPVENQTWISSRGAQAVSDGGLIGNKMKEWWPNPSKLPIAHPRYYDGRDRVRLYPKLPATIHMYKNSVVVDGVLVEQSGGKTFVIDGYCFYGSKVYVKEKETQKYLLADEMLVRASLLTGWYAKATDYRCYAVVPPNMTLPWLNDRGYGIPDPGIFRKDMDFMFYVSALIGIIRQRDKK